jgi:iron complex outermembrane receptor protein
VRVDFGTDNLFNTYYVLPLGGVDLVDDRAVSMMGTSAAYGFNVPAPGRSLNGRLTVKF